MACEKLNFSYDTNELVKCLDEIRNAFPIFMQTENFGGWSVTSNDGSYKSGWGEHHEEFSNINCKDIYQVREQLKARNISTIKDQNKHTEVCMGYIKNIMQDLEFKGFYPRRARLSYLAPKSATIFHRDAPDWLYYVRMHIPILTNPSCFFEYESDREHLFADGSVYLAKVNTMHKTVNYGAEARYHLIMDVWDTKGFSSFHRYKDINYLKSYFGY